MRNFYVLLALMVIVRPVIAADSQTLFLAQTDESILITSDEPSKQEMPYEQVGQNTTDAFALKNNRTQALSQLPYHREVALAAQETGLEASLLHAIIVVESRHNSQARSSKGALGLMQLMPATAKKYHVTQTTNPQQNVLAGARYFKTLLGTFDNNLTLAIAAYNAGPQAVLNHHSQIPPYAETQRYVPKVLAFYARYKTL